MAALARVGGAAASRHEPVDPSPTSLLRRRLVGALRGRFERRLTVIQAGAGFGKSTLLSQALHENRLEQHGTDVLVRVLESDQDPDQLVAGFAEALGLVDPSPTVDQVCDAVWAKAPASVALVVDDSHRLGVSESAWEVLRCLIDRLPSNGHLVVSGRRAPKLPVARLLSQDQALVLTEDDLGFTDAELGAVGELRGIPATLVAQLPRWPALATLTGVVGHSASFDYLWDEVLRALPAERQRLLAAAALFGQIDDELASALGSDVPAAELVDGVPLVEANVDGSFHLHDLWADALKSVLSPAEQADALCAGGSMLLDRGELLRAAEAFSLAGDDDGMSKVVLAFARQPTGNADVNEINRLHALLPETLQKQPGARYLEAARFYATDDRQAALVFEQAAAEARRSGELELEVLARWRHAQFIDLDRPGGPPLTDRLQELADDGVPLARGVCAFIASRHLEYSGDPDGALRVLTELDDFDPAQQAMSMAMRLLDLGRPEMFDVTLESVLTSGVSDMYAALAVWLRGEIEPADAWPVARELPLRGPSVPLTTRVGLNAIVVIMAVAAGRHDEVATLSEANVREAQTAPGLVQLFADVAAALHDLVTVDEETAVASFTKLLDEVPLEGWPERPYMYALCTIRGLVEGAEVLDDFRMGPSMTVALHAGAALAALRQGDTGPAAALPWDRPTLLRVHVPPPLLVELALAAGATPGAAAVLEAAPHLRTWLRRIAERRGPGALRDLAKRAALAAQAMPARPEHDLRINVLGGLSLERSDGRLIEGWDRRERVRHLLAYLALHRDVARAEVAAELWPDLPPEKGASNLRVNLHHLQRAVQPDRDPDDPPWFVQADGTRLWLAGDGVTIDSELVHEAMASAVRAEAAGVPSEALHHYERVEALAAGELLGEITADWVVYERMRLRSVVHAAAARQGELVLGRGEPEAALRIAARAQRLDPLSERAHRLSIRCHVALGSASAARDAAVALEAVLADGGIAPEPETMVLVSSLQP